MRAASGSRSITERAAPACTPIAETWCATTSCSSRAMRTRSSATACAAVTSRSRSSSSVRCRSASLRERRRVRPLAHVVRAAEEGRVDEELHEHACHERREQARARESVVGVGGRRLERRDEQPREHPDDDRDAHDRRRAGDRSTHAPTVYMPMNSTMLPTYISGIWKRHRDEERQRRRDGDDLREAPTHREGRGEGDGVEQRPLHARRLVAVDAGDGAESRAEDRGEHQGGGEPHVGAQLGGGGRRAQQPRRDGFGHLSTVRGRPRRGIPPATEMRMADAT